MLPVCRRGTTPSSRSRIILTSLVDVPTTFCSAVLPRFTLCAIRSRGQKCRRHTMSRSRGHVVGSGGRERPRPSVRGLVHPHRRLRAVFALAFPHCGGVIRKLRCERLRPLDSSADFLLLISDCIPFRCSRNFLIYVRLGGKGVPRDFCRRHTCGSARTCPQDWCSPSPPRAKFALVLPGAGLSSIRLPCL